MQKKNRAYTTLLQKKKTESNTFLKDLENLLSLGKNHKYYEKKNILSTIPEEKRADILKKVVSNTFLTETNNTINKQAETSVGANVHNDASSIISLGPTFEEKQTHIIDETENMIEIEYEKITKQKKHRKNRLDFKSDFFNATPRQTFYQAHIEPNITETEQKENYIYKHCRNLTTQSPKTFRLRQTMSDFRKPSGYKTSRASGLTSPNNEALTSERNFFKIKTLQDNDQEDHQSKNYNDKKTEKKLAFLSKPSVINNENNYNFNREINETKIDTASVLRKQSSPSMPDGILSKTYNTNFFKSLKSDQNESKALIPDKIKYMNGEEIYNTILDKDTDLDEMRVSLLSFRDKAKYFSYDLYRSFDNLMENKPTTNLDYVVKRFVDKVRSKKLDATDYRNAMKHHRNYKKIEKDDILDFLNQIKTKDNRNIVRKLQENNNYVKGYDHIGLSSLHWAVLKEDLQLTDQFCQLGADLNSKDLLDRTPIFFAVKSQNYSLTRILLLARALPWSTDAYNLLDMAKSPELFSMIKSAKRLHLLLDLAPGHAKMTLWKKQSLMLLTEKPDHGDKDNQIKNSNKEVKKDKAPNFRFIRKRFQSKDN